MTQDTRENGFSDTEDSDYSATIDAYDIVTIPNDFNLETLINYFEKSKIEVPDFQRSYVWDKKTASKFIESLLIKLPVPPIYLYYTDNNKKFCILDGQQRLLSMFFFVKGVFPRQEKRAELRKFLTKKSTKNSLQSLLEDKESDIFQAFFEDFSLSLSSVTQENRLNKKTFENLSDDQQEHFSISTIRTFVIKQNEPKTDNTAIYEMYDRLNTGGKILKPQEIRTNLYQSDFYKALDTLNEDENWRYILDTKEEDKHLQDVESLLRAFALLMDFDNYKAPMTNFLNTFSNKIKISETSEKYFTHEHISRAKNLLHMFLKNARNLDAKTFQNTKKQFSNTLFEAVFLATCQDLYQDFGLDIAQNFKHISQDYMNKMKEKASGVNEEFYKLSVGRSANKENIKDRVKIAKEVFAEMA